MTKRIGNEELLLNGSGWIWKYGDLNLKNYYWMDNQVIVENEVMRKTYDQLKLASGIFGVMQKCR